MRQFTYRDVRIDTHHWGTRGEFSLRLTHVPTGETTFGSGSGEEFRVRDPAMMALRDKVVKNHEGWE